MFIYSPPWGDRIVDIIAPVPHPYLDAEQTTPSSVQAIPSAKFCFLASDIRRVSPGYDGGSPKTPFTITRMNMVSGLQDTATHCYVNAHEKVPPTISSASPLVP